MVLIVEKQRKFPVALLIKIIAMTVLNFKRIQTQVTNHKTRKKENRCAPIAQPMGSPKIFVSNFMGIQNGSKEKAKQNSNTAANVTEKQIAMPKELMQVTWNSCT